MAEAKDRFAKTELPECCALFAPGSGLRYRHRLLEGHEPVEVIQDAESDNDFDFAYTNGVHAHRASVVLNMLHEQYRPASR